MINVVLLLVSFFLLGQFKVASPIAVSLPTSISVENPTSKSIVFVDSIGEMYFENLKGDAAIAVLKTIKTPVTLNVDRRTDANLALRVWKDLKAVGVEIVAVGVAK